MNRRAIAMIFVCLSVRLSVCLQGRACIMIIQCIEQCSGHPDTEACPPTPSRLYPVPPKREVWYGCTNYKRDISTTVEDRS